MDIDKLASWEEVHKMAKAAQETAEREREEIEKGRVYIKPGERPPKGATLRRGPKGGMYYERQAPKSGDYPKYEQRSRSYRFGAPTKPDWMPTAEWNARKKEEKRKIEEGPKE